MCFYLCWIFQDILNQNSDSPPHIARTLHFWGPPRGSAPQCTLSDTRPHRHPGCCRRRNPTVAVIVIFCLYPMFLLECSHHWSKVGSDLHTRSFPVDSLFGYRSWWVEVERRWSSQGLGRSPLGKLQDTFHHPSHTSSHGWPHSHRQSLLLDTACAQRCHWQSNTCIKSM